MAKKKLMDVAELGRQGGATRAANMTPEERSEAARKAAEARWGKRRGESKSKKAT